MTDLDQRLLNEAKAVHAELNLSPRQLADLLADITKAKTQRGCFAAEDRARAALEGRS